MHRCFPHVRRNSHDRAKTHAVNLPEDLWLWLECVCGEATKKSAPTKGAE